MVGHWILSTKLTMFLAHLIAGSDLAAVASEYYPAIMWSGGGWMEGPDHIRKPLGPRYSIGLVDKASLHDYKIVLPDKRFGYVIFSPKPEDDKSSRRLIDFDGKTIVVR